MGHLNGFFALRGENLKKAVFKSSYYQYFAEDPFGVVFALFQECGYGFHVMVDLGKFT